MEFERVVLFVESRDEYKRDTDKTARAMRIAETTDTKRNSWGRYKRDELIILERRREEYKLILSFFRVRISIGEKDGGEAKSDEKH